MMDSGDTPIDFSNFDLTFAKYGSRIDPISAIATASTVTITTWVSPLLRTSAFAHRGFSPASSPGRVISTFATPPRISSADNGTMKRQRIMAASSCFMNRNHRESRKIKPLRQDGLVAQIGLRPSSHRAAPRRGSPHLTVACTLAPDPAVTSRYHAGLAIDGFRAGAVGLAHSHD